jgi:hypothetical protein
VQESREGRVAAVQWAVDHRKVFLRCVFHPSLPTVASGSRPQRLSSGSYGPHPG